MIHIFDCLVRGKAFVECDHDKKDCDICAEELFDRLGHHPEMTVRDRQIERDCHSVAQIIAG